jgi:uncharacterized membrane protein YphA (DoxX/SURF4 family)
MLNPFPSLLTYALFAPTLLRIVAAVAFAWMAYRQWRGRDALSTIHFPVVGKGVWIVWASILANTIAAVGLLLGYGTQWAALLGALLALKSAVWDHRYPTFFPLSRVASLLLLVLCLSLLLSGAGALAFDIAL